MVQILTSYVDECEMGLVSVVVVNIILHPSASRLQCLRRLEALLKQILKLTWSSFLSRSGPFSSPGCRGLGTPNVNVRQVSPRYTPGDRWASL